MVILTWWIIFLLLLRRSFRWRTSSPCELILRWKEIIPRMEVSKRLFWSNFDPILIQRWQMPFQKCQLINWTKLFQNLITKAEDAPNPEVKCWFHPACFIIIISGFLSQLVSEFFCSFSNNHRYQKLDARADRQTGTIILNIKKNECVLIFARFVHIFSSIRPNYVINATLSHTMLTCWKIWYGSFWPTCTQNAKKCREMKRKRKRMICNREFFSVISSLVKYEHRIAVSCQRLCFVLKLNA